MGYAFEKGKETRLKKPKKVKNIVIIPDEILKSKKDIDRWWLERAYMKTKINKVKNVKSVKEYRELSPYDRLFKNLYALKEKKRDREIKLVKYVKEGNKGWGTRTINNLGVIYREIYRTQRAIDVASKFISKGGDLTKIDAYKLERANYLSKFVRVDVIKMVAMGRSSGSEGLDRRINELIQEFADYEELNEYLNNIEIMGTVDYFTGAVRGAVENRDKFNKIKELLKHKIV